jgi:Na+-driven multidrug efflux pump
MVYNYSAAMIRSAGDSKRPMIFLAISGLVNVLLNIVLVTVFGMGVEGVAIATIVSQYLSAAMSLVYLTRTNGPLRMSFKDLKISASKVKKILYIGIPSGIQSSLFSLSNVVIQSSINGFGDTVMAGSAASANVEALVYVAMNSIYHVALTFIGQNVGAKKYKNIRRLTVYSALIVTAVGLGCAVLLFTFKESVLSLYVSSPEAMDAALTRFYVIMPTYFLCGLMDVFCGGLRALDRSVTAMIVSLAGACGLRILWIATVFKMFPTPITIYLSYPITWTVTAAFQLAFMIIAAKKIMHNDRLAQEFSNRQKQEIGEEINELT